MRSPYGLYMPSETPYQRRQRLDRTIKEAQNAADAEWRIRRNGRRCYRLTDRVICALILDPIRAIIRRIFTSRK